MYFEKGRRGKRNWPVTFDIRCCAVLLAAVLCGLWLSADALYAAADNGLGTALLGAVINADGTVANSSGLVSASRFSTGGYTLVFNRDVASCIYAAVPMFATGALVTVSGRDGANLDFNLNSQSTGALINSDFSVVVFCPN
jgi:hypothetical protein